MTIDPKDLSALALARADELVDPQLPDPRILGWEEPLPLPSQAFPVPGFPVEVLGKASAFVCAVAEETGTPEDLAALAVLGVTSTLTAGSVVVEGPWSESTNLYLAGIAAPGEGKSPALRRCAAVLDSIETERRDRMMPEIIEAQTRKEVLADRAKVAKLVAAKANADSRLEDEQLAIDAAAALAELTVPSVPRVYTREATPEGLCRLLAEQSGRLGVVTDEGGEFFELAGRYGAKGKENFGIYLAGWDGDRYVSDRASRDSVVIEKTTLSAILLAQPVVVETLGGNRQAKGRGLLDRFLWSRPWTIVGQRAVQRPAVGDAQTAEYARLMATLAAEAEAARDGPVGLGLDAEAALHFLAWHKRHEPRLREVTGDLHHIVGWASKLPGQVLRLAGNLHALRTGTIHGVIAGDEMESAVTLAGYFTAHARLVFGTMQADQATLDAEAVLRWIQHKREMDFTTRRLCRSKDWDADRVRAALRSLERHGWVRSLDVPE
jgi:hypothetical protein